MWCFPRRTLRFDLLDHVGLVARLDTMLGAYLRFQEPALHQEHLLTGGVGRYTAEEWTLARRLGYRGAGVEGAEISTDTAYLKRLLSHDTQVRNIVSAHRLVRSFDLTSYGSVLEIGCGEMAQALVIKALIPELEYEATDLDAGNPVELGQEYAELKNRLPRLSVLGGCCGTDLRHVEQIATACLPLFREATRQATEAGSTPG